MYLALGMVVLLAFHLYSFSGMKGFDGIEYARHAAELLRGELELDGHHFAYRWAVVLPAVFFYKLLGINDLSSALPAVMATLGILILLAGRLRAASSEENLWVVLLFVLSPNVLYYCDKLMPDIQVALGSMLALWARASTSPCVPTKGTFSIGPLSPESGSTCKSTI